jgi:hypothetical protein
MLFSEVINEGKIFLFLPSRCIKIKSFLFLIFCYELGVHASVRVCVRVCACVCVRALQAGRNEDGKQAFYHAPAVVLELERIFPKLMMKFFHSFFP